MNILVTGGSSGLGREITERFAGISDHRVYFTYNTSEAAAQEIERQFPNTKAISCNFGDMASVQRLLEGIEMLDLDVLVNNAHTKYSQQHFHKIAAEAFSQDFQTNLLPTLLITQKAIAGFRKKKGGRIINIISTAIINTPTIGLSVYTAQKAYLLSMSKSWAAEGIRFNMSSNCVSPAFMATPMTADYDERTIDQLVESHPLKQLLQPGEVAGAVLFLASASPQINGINLVLNAGVDMI